MLKLYKLATIPKKVSTWITFLVTSLMLSSMAFANPAGGFREPTPTDLADITTVVQRAAGWLLGLAGAFFVIMFMMKGFKLATTAGNPRDRADAIGGLLWTGVGAIVTFGAWFLVGVVMGIGEDPAGI